MEAPLHIAILWHMHQPYYKDPLKKEYALPWTFLHAIKDYYDMAAIVEECPEARVTFNLVPSLIEQILDYASGNAVDPFLTLGMMPPSDMGEEERLFLLENFFSANRQRMIEPYPRYLELLYLSGDGGDKQEHLRRFRDQDIIDLQVCFFLAWTGEVARRRFPVLAELIAKGRFYTNDDKELLFNTLRQITGEIIPLYRRLAEEGRVDLGVSPFYHPILPLLCDTRAAQTAMPKVNLPANHFRHPEDARRQVESAVAYFTDIFGFPPSGMWPSEGSVSDEALSIIAAAGFGWVATDEGVLANTLGSLGPGKEALYHPYTFHAADRDLPVLFRDHSLSDLIGFTYSQWDAERGVEDFISRLQEIRRRSHGSRVVAIILDGENAWEYYNRNGEPFLSRLYAALGKTMGLKPATFSEVLTDVPERLSLRHIHPGSWINANYGIWIGHPEENLGWDYLYQAREAAVAANPEVAGFLAGMDIGYGEAADTARLVCTSLDAAEGSDWFWWYGDDHFSPHSDRFDALFRNHLTNIYRLLRLEVPRHLFEPIKKKSIAGFVREPAAMITPAINGVVTDYYEWLAAGLFDLSRQSSAMHAAESLLHSFFYGFDRKYFYFRIDGNGSLESLLMPGDILGLHLFLDREFRICMTVTEEDGPLLVKGPERWEPTGILAQWKIVRTCEVRIPVAPLNPEPGGKFFAVVTLQRDHEEIGRWPTDSPMLLKYAGPDIEVENWLI